MLVNYNIRTNAAHLLFGLLEDTKLKADQKKRLKKIDEIINKITEESEKMLKKIGTSNIKEAVEKAQKNKKIDKELTYFMKKVYPNLQKEVIKLVKEYNIQYCPNYKETLNTPKES